MILLPQMIDCCDTFLRGFAQPVNQVFLNELPRRKQRGIKNFKFCHSALDAESSPVFWIPAGVYPVLDTGPE